MKSKLNSEKILCKILRDYGFDFATGVPCGVLQYFINHFISSSYIKHVAANREAEALGIATGAFLAGRKPIVYMQNSGLMDSLNELTSLLMPYKIPLVLLVSWRGSPGEDAPQHFINGKNTLKILKNLGIPAIIIFKENIKSIPSFLKIADKKQIPSVILIQRGILK